MNDSTLKVNKGKNMECIKIDYKDKRYPRKVIKY